MSPSIPKTVIFLTADAYGVLPPISKLNKNQAMYYFLSGYTSKVAGTEIGVTEPTPTFSTCFGEPFLPLDPSVYAKMLAEKVEKSGARVYLVNTGWNGTGKRMKLSYTRAMDKTLDVRRAACQTVGGVGDRYTCLIWGQECYLWLEKGRWFVAAKE